MTDCNDCNAALAFGMSVGIFYLLSFVIHVVLPVFAVSNPGKLGKKLNKSGKAWAVVTGTTSGIGHAFVSALAGLGFNVLMIARNGAKLNEIKAEISQKHKSIKIECMVIDLATKSVITSDLSKFIAANEVAILVNNAGLNTDFPKLFTDASLAETESILDVNCGALTKLTHAVLPGMLARRSGQIINISSLFGQLSGPLVATYSGTKSYIDSFSLSLSEELRNTGVSVLCSMPGFVVSNMSKIRRTSFTVMSPEACVRAVLGQAACGRLTIACPHWTHAAIGWALTSLLPQWLRLRIVGNINRATNKAALRKAASKGVQGR